MGSVTFHLLVGGYGAEDDLGEFTTVEWAICNSTIIDKHWFEASTVYTYPTTSSGFLTIAIERCVRSYTSRAM